MRESLLEGLNLAQQLAALPFKAAREAIGQLPLSERPLGDVVEESLRLGEGLARLPFKATAAVVEEVAARRPGLGDLEARLSDLERRLGVADGNIGGDPTDPA